MPYRFSFETDQQYEARVGNQSDPVSAQSTSQTGTTPARVPQHIDAASPGIRVLFLIPWWGLVIAFLAIKVLSYELERRAMRKSVADVPDPVRPKKTSFRRKRLVQRWLKIIRLQKRRWKARYRKILRPSTRQLSEVNFQPIPVLPIYIRHKLHQPARYGKS